MEDNDDFDADESCPQWKSAFDATTTILDGTEALIVALEGQAKAKELARFLEEDFAPFFEQIQETLEEVQFDRDRALEVATDLRDEVDGVTEMLADLEGVVEELEDDLKGSPAAELSSALSNARKLLGSGRHAAGIFVGTG